MDGLVIYGQMARWDGISQSNETFFLTAYSLILNEQHGIVFLFFLNDSVRHVYLLLTL